MTDAEHRFVEPFEAKRVELSDKAAGKLVQLMQDIVAGDAEMLRQAPYEGSRAKRPSGWPPPTGDEAEKSRVRLAVRKHLRLASLFGFGPVGYDYLNDARAAKALDVIREATDMILMQARRRLSRRVVLSASNSQQVAQRPLARDVIRFVPGFFDDNLFTTPECFTWVVMHEYMHLAGAFHGEDSRNRMRKFEGYKPEFALADADSLTALVFDLAMGDPFPVDCHRDPAKPPRTAEAVAGPEAAALA